MEIQNVKEINKGAVVLSFSVYFREMGMTINDCLFMRSKGKTWVTMPSRKYEKDNETKYYPYVFWDKDKKEKLDRAIMEKLPAGSETETKSDLPF